MIEWLLMARWSPYLVGAGIGVLIWTAFLLSDRPLGCSTAYAKTAGMVEVAVSRDSAKAMPYYQKITPTIDWQWILLIGIVIGAFLSAYLSGTLSLLLIPPLFAAQFGMDPLLRLATALVGGIFLGFGARFAGGCTSGHGISGTLQLSLVSWVAAICFFAGGILVAGLLFGFGGAGG
ncbi:MAG TPA: YeeE/YedE family protein [Methanoregula sp.]|nr:YeeE/YedE family protein [Methanoregula sp.]